MHERLWPQKRIFQISCTGTWAICMDWQCRKNYLYMVLNGRKIRFFPKGIKIGKKKKLFCNFHSYRQVTMELIVFHSSENVLLGLISLQLCLFLCAAWQTFLTSSWLNAGDIKIVQGSFMVSLKWQYSEICRF